MASSISRSMTVAAVTLSLALSCAGLALSAGRDTAAGGQPAALDGAALAKLKHKYRRPANVPYPKNNPYSGAKAELGKALFFDPRLSGSNLLSCASCHNPSFAWGDGQARATGHGMHVLGRHTPTAANLAWTPMLFWDGRAGSLEEQALGPIGAPGEMNTDLAQLPAKLDAIPEYKQLFAAAFPGEAISNANLAKAIATFERTIVTGTAPFDRWIGGDESAISESAKRGFVVFNGKANCAACHSGWNFTDDSFHDIGLPGDDIGRAKIVPAVEKLSHAFKVPGLREIAQRAPYMHDGSVPTLEAVVEHYEDGNFAVRASLSEEMKRYTLTPQQKQDLVAFLKTLSSQPEPVALPVLRR